MNKVMLAALLSAGLPMAAQASTDHSGLYSGPTAQARIGFGGDELVAVTYTNGDTDHLKAGDGLEAAVGWHFQSYRNAPFDLRAQVGYRYQATRNSSNANFKLGRVTWELIPSLQLGAGFWAGAGLLLHSNIKLSSDTSLPDARFKNALGGDFQLGWRWIALTYTSMHYKVVDTGQKFDASNFGAQFTYSFGWPCCRAARPLPARNDAPTTSAPARGEAWEEAPSAIEPPAEELMPPGAAAPVPASAPVTAEAPAAVAVPTPVESPVPVRVATPAPVRPDAAPAAATVSRTPKVPPRAAPPRATLLTDAQLCGRPLPTSTDNEWLAAGTEVHLVSKTINITGAWWYVVPPGHIGGWVNESELGAITR